MKCIPFIALAFFIISCQDNKHSGNSEENNAVHKDTSVVKEGEVAQNTDPYQGCFRSVTGRDTLTLHLERKGDQYTGRMHFDNFEKDASQGPVNGTLENGTLHLWYSFDSEGMHSVMEVILKSGDNGLVRAMSPITNRGDTTVFRDPGSLEYPRQNPLLRVDCSELKAIDL